MTDKKTQNASRAFVSLWGVDTILGIDTRKKLKKALAIVEAAKTTIVNVADSNFEDEAKDEAMKTAKLLDISLSNIKLAIEDLHEYALVEINRS